MTQVFRRAWEDMVLPIFKRPRRVQVAALCYRDTEAGKKVLLITSRDTGRWILPKGWPIDGLDGSGAALQEAWEEAGVTEADIESDPMGIFDYDKGLGEGLTVPVTTQVYLTRVRDLSEEYPEADMRKRAWFTPQEASELVDEPDLKAILAAFH
ncbi:NUDIX hydrolase [Sulfitobacter sp. W027]|jgi:8-oxo-dGTP pyrophosphatase MutT (NUDIX family)|uniref:NUDIX hydrolase n=1 Tax=Sulfitobacter sp. W027 TaxID=2867025 RepID=UPI0021A376C8|nr:NUDIX hydrolase [Sulfitobacter sp. W027]UWR32595.1 NUDIX hydrolase [Sulfitobacter sp. W027]